MANTSNPQFPQHIGLILDGNRRWARQHGVPIIEGHRKGYENLKDISISALSYGVRYISAYVFSTENWQRERDEVRQLMKLFLWVMKHEVKELNSNGIRLRVVGSKVKLGKALIKAIHNAEQATENNTRGTLLLCLDYGGQQEIVEAVKKIHQDGVSPDEIDPELITKYLYAPDVPPPDLIIRTSGEQRLSNFMLWESAYSELMFSKTYWPDFSKKELKKVINRYAKIQRRFGK